MLSLSNHSFSGFFVFVSPSLETNGEAVIEFCLIVFLRGNDISTSIVVVCRVYQIHKLVDGRKEECWISDLCVRESVDIKNSQYSSLFDHSRDVCILTSRSNRLQFGMARGFLQQENRSRMRLTLTRVVFLLGSSNLLFLRSSNYSLDSRPISWKNSSYEPSGS